MESKKLIPELRFPEFSGEWIEKRLGEVCEIVMGQSPDSKFYNQNKNGLPLIQGANDFEKINNYTTQITKICEKNNIIMSVRAPVGTLTKAKQKSCIGRGVCAIKGNDFIYYVLIKNQRKLKIYSQGTTFEAINSKDLKSLKIHIPPTLKEQQKIASFLSAVDEKIEITAKRIEKLKEYKKGLLQKLLNVKNGVPELRFPEFSGKWVEKRLGEIATIKKGIQLNKLNMIENGQYPVINGGIEASGHTNDFNTNENTITISEGGNSCGYVNFIKTKFWCGGHCYKLESIKVNKKYLYFILKKEETKIMRLRVGSGLPNIQKNDLVKYKLYFPPTIEEQQKIASFLSSIDEKIELNEQILDKMKEYKRGLLQKMFV